MPDIFRISYKEGQEGLYHVDIRRKKNVFKRYEVETTDDGDIMPVGEVPEDIDAAIRAVLGMFVDA